YKAGRAVMPDELAVQIPILKETLDLMGIPRFELPSFEADDLLGTISRILCENGHESVIVTGDRDTLQLIGERSSVKLVSTKMGKPTTTDFDEARFKEEYAGLEPCKIIDLKALAGDKSDNIPGVSGIGDKTALDLIAQFDSLDHLYQNLQSEKIRDSVRKKLEQDRDNAFLSYQLATIDRNAPLPFMPTDAVLKEQDDVGLYELFMRLEFRSFIEKKNLTPANNKEKKLVDEPQNIIHVSNKDSLIKFMDKAKKAEHVFLAAPNSLNAAAVVCDNEMYLLMDNDFSETEWESFIGEFYSPSVKKVVHDCKPLLVSLFCSCINPGGFMFDTALGAYLLSPADTGYAIEKCVLTYLETEIPADTAYQSADAFSVIDGAEEALRALSMHAVCVKGLYRAIEPKIKELNMESLYFNIELPLAEVLASMQNDGFLIDSMRLHEFGISLGQRIDECTAKIYKICEQEFNINSTKALGEILFVKLGLPVVKKTKTGFSTDVEVLNKLKGRHEIIELIIEYRQLTKLKSTYVDGLSKVISTKDGRIHSSFNQMVTLTGRLSSTEPNLQNIPARRELGSEIRHMFVAKDQCILLDADYSQIELRVLAHIAGDEKMIEAFRSGEDIHSVTASQVFHVELNEVTHQMRRAAKAVNFGIVYGISAFSLSEDIGVSVSEANRYMESYFEKYAGVKKYMDEIRKKAKEDGYVTTLSGRRRYLPELRSSNFNIRSFGERVALNTPIQGTAADIIKIAMVNVYNQLKKEHLRSRLILQVHDELIIETYEDEKETVAKLLKAEMEGAYHLDAALLAEVSAGKTWYDAKR
ncbi:MAG: DNA polymerase I, partial [Clostridiales bacterium]|nr:DNA polymerase I [Clostridiales bacterium]